MYLAVRQTAARMETIAEIRTKVLPAGEIVHAMLVQFPHLETLVADVSESEQWGGPRPDGAAR